ncbi:hypothetical protein D1821_18600 (plasmid) [Phaeobacter inhibens]|nr:hypothetical protein D1821_18600 [Phaeobacter inhibens]
MPAATLHRPADQIVLLGLGALVAALILLVAIFPPRLSDGPAGGVSFSQNWCLRSQSMTGRMLFTS